jgi:hypothetical protein
MGGMFELFGHFGGELFDLVGQTVESRNLFLLLYRTHLSGWLSYDQFGSLGIEVKRPHHELAGSSTYISTKAAPHRTAPSVIGLIAACNSHAVTAWNHLRSTILVRYWFASG